MKSNLFRLNFLDAGRGIAVAVLAAILTYLVGALNTPGFEFSAIDWAYIVKIALTSGISYMIKNFLSDESGKLGGVL